LNLTICATKTTQPHPDIQVHITSWR